jgi:hypothetical protein
VIGTDLYAGGNFTLAGGVSGTSYVAKWNGTTWSALGTGANSSVSALANYSGSIVAGTGSQVLQTGVAALNAIAYSAVTAGSGDPWVLYTDSAGSVYAKTYTAGSWGAAYTVQASGVSSAPVLVAGQTSQTLYALWYRGDAVEYKYFNGTIWDASPTVLVSAATASRYASCDPYADGGIIKCIYTTGTSAPFSVSSAIITP